MHWGSIALSIVIIILSILFLDQGYWSIGIVAGLIIGASSFVFTLMREASISAKKEEMFLEFARNLVESVKTGTPISKSIINMKSKSYGVLSKNIEKLANQISIGIPFNFALQVFAKDVENRTISRALTLIGQAERAGGDIGEILEAVAEATHLSDKLKKERKASISTLVIQGYIIFFVFMIIILVMQFKIIPMISGIADMDLGLQSQVSTGGQIDQEGIANSFLYLLLIQGFFSGLIIGKLSEGSVKSGVKHSFALVISSFLFSAVARIFFV